MYNLAVIGATGLVGRAMIQKLLATAEFGESRILAAASPGSKGKILEINDRSFEVITVDEALAAKPQIALFSAGAGVSGQYAGQFAGQGCFVIDNSSFWRMYPDVPLVVPEINAHSITSETRVIANPNCSTIQLVLALSGLHSRYKIRRIVVSTYQSVTGSGQKGIDQLNNEESGLPIAGYAYPHQIYRNLIPHGGNFTAGGYTTEEIKLVDETRKILGDSSIMVTATVVRVPVKGGHSESVNVEFGEEFALSDVRQILGNTPGVVIQDDPAQNLYPMPLYAEGRDEVFVGRIRRDESRPSCLNLWIVSDNLLKGAATNAVQIAGYLAKQNLAGPSV